MKKLVMILMLGAVVASCTETPIEVENPKQETTIELQQLASIDTTAYKVVQKDQTVYILSTKDNTVVKKVNNDSGVVKTLISTVFVVLIIMGITVVLI